MHLKNATQWSLYNILNLENDFNIFVNGDCRGYALKIFDDYIRKNDITIYRDWGGYGIIAPDFTPQ